ncbi:MAG TPA: TolC family protein, partial [Epsilonproteobacteria bacterium]|nr:TolC family protein [Campylobacterota bacterium]
LETEKLISEKVFQTRKAFYDISLVENYIENLTQIMKNIDRLERIVKSMKTEGYAQNIDLLEVQARKAEAESMLSQATLNRELAYQFLSFLLNVEVSSIVRVEDMAVRPEIATEMLEAKNIDIQKAKLGLEITDMAVGVERSKFLPQVGAFAEYGSANNKLFDEFEEKDAYTVGVQLTWNLFSGGSDYASFEKARVNRLKVKSQVALAKSGIALQAKKFQTEIDGKTSHVKSYQKQLKFAQEVYKNYQARYKEGIVSISDVLIKQSKELEILLKLLTVKNERNTKVFELESLINQANQQ